jgi:hypothetical protein
MGHITFCLLHLIALLFGFVGLFLTIPLHLIYSAFAGKKEEPRADGKPKTSGPFGWIIDNAEVKHKMRDCPLCFQKIMKAASKCPHCSGEVDQTDITPLDEKEYKKSKTIYWTLSIGVALIVFYFLFLFSKGSA